MASNLLAMASKLRALASNLLAMASKLRAMVSNLLAMTSKVRAMASNLRGMVSNLRANRLGNVANNQKDGDEPAITDNGNYIVDLKCSPQRWVFETAFHLLLARAGWLGGLR